MPIYESRLVNLIFGEKMKAMSIIGIVWFSLSLILIVILLGNNDLEAAAGWGILGLFYAIPYSITGLVIANKNTKI